MLPNAQFGRCTWAEEGMRKNKRGRMDKKAGSFIRGSEKVMHLHLI